MTTRVRLAGALMLACVAGCITSTGSVRAGARPEFREVLSQARAAASAGRYADADRLLAQFSVRYPGSEQAAETEYWRAVFQLDPANRDGSVTTALQDLDQYLSGSPKLPHYDEASMLRRLGAQLQTATRLATTSVTTQTTTRSVTTDSRDEEMQKLKDQLAKANEELDRIKKRLAAPTRP